MSKAKKTPLEPHADRLAAFKALPDSEKWARVHLELSRISPKAASLADDIAYDAARGGGDGFKFESLFAHAKETAPQLWLHGWLTFDPRLNPSQRIELSDWGRFMLKMMEANAIGKFF